MLLVMNDEEREMRRALKDMPLQNCSPVVSASVMGQVQSALSNVKNDAELKKSAEQAYGAWLGYYNTNCKKCGWSKEMLVQRANEMASDLGLDYQPRLQKKTVGKMGLKGVAGLLTE